MDFSEAARGAKIYCTVKFGALQIDITQTTVSLFAVTVFLMLAAFIVTRKISKRPGKMQVIVEKLVTMLYDLVEGTMGKHNSGFAPYIGTLFLSSFFCSTIGMTYVFRSATADLMVTLAWALVTSVLVWFFNIKNYGFFAWLKGFTEPIIIMTPMNVISEIAQPVSMAFRHFGNMVGGSVLTYYLYSPCGCDLVCIRLDISNACFNPVLAGWYSRIPFDIFRPLFRIRAGSRFLAFDNGLRRRGLPSTRGEKATQKKESCLIFTRQAFCRTNRLSN